MSEKKLFCLILIILSSVYAQTSADSLLNFINANTTRSSLYLKQNDTVLAHLNENSMMPLASTVKILVAVEFAKQAANKIFNENDMISINELNKYYLPNTDGGTHPNWITYENNLGHIKNDSVALINAERGMIIFSSNAKTQFLMDLVGLYNITHDNELLGIKTRTRIYPLVDSLFLYQNPKKKSEDYIL